MNSKSKNTFNISLYLLIAAAAAIFFSAAKFGESVLLDQPQNLLMESAIALLVGGAVVVSRVCVVPVQLLGFAIIPACFGGLLSATLNESNHVLSAGLVMLVGVAVAIVISVFHNDLLKDTDEGLNVTLVILVACSVICQHTFNIEPSVINSAIALIFMCCLERCITNTRDKPKTFTNNIRSANSMFLNIGGMFVSVLCILS